MDARRMRTQSTRYLKTARTKSVTFAEQVTKEEFEVPSTSSSSSSLSSLEDDKERQKEIQEIEAEAKRKAKESEEGRSRSETGADSNQPLVKKGVSFRGTTNEPLKGDGDGSRKKMGRLDSFASRTTSIFHIRRGVAKPEEQKDTSQKEFVYANIIRVEDDEEEMQEKERENTVGSGVSYTAETTYIEQEMGNKILGSYKTNDNWYFGRTDRPKTSKINRRVVFCGIFILLGLLALITTTILVIPRPDDAARIALDHSKVYVEVGSRLERKLGTAGKCQYERTCPTICSRAIERQEGCCLGCPAREDDPLNDDCNFNITVGFNNVTELTIRQRIYLFASLDGRSFFQTGFAPPVIKSEDVFVTIEKEVIDPLDPTTVTTVSVNETLSYANESIIPNACLSVANQPILFVACLSDYDLFDFSFKGFPYTYCSSFRGICFNTNNALMKPMDGCVATGLDFFEWEGNRYNTVKEWEENFEEITPLHDKESVQEKDRPKVEIESYQDSSAVAATVSVAVVAVAATALLF